MISVRLFAPRDQKYLVHPVSLLHISRTKYSPGFPRVRYFRMNHLPRIPSVPSLNTLVRGLLFYVFEGNLFRVPVWFDPLALAIRHSDMTTRDSRYVCL